MQPRLTIVLLSLLLAACAPVVTSAQPTITPPPTVTSTPPPPTATASAIPSPSPESSPSPRPTINVVMTPDAVQVERWKEYDDALAKAVFNVESLKDVLCEWVILGQSGQEVYVWVVCRDQHGGGSLPAVIYLGSNGSIQNIKTSRSIQEDYLIFPEDVRKKFEYYESGGVEELLKHLEMRRENPEEPPLVVLSAIPLPTQTPPPPTMPSMITPDAAQVEHWQEYQTELAKGILPMEPPEIVLCEWDILARSGDEVYVWAFCVSPGVIEDMRPAIIHLGADGSLQRVEIPKRGSGDIDKLFPEAARVKFSLYTGDSIFSGRLRKMLDHIDYRETHPEEPPLIVLSATPMP